MPNTRTTRHEAESDLVLDALLDLYAHPVWIISGSGKVRLNAKARAIQDQGCRIDEINQLQPLASVTFKGRKYRFRKIDMNHGTDCYLHELKDEDDGIAAMRDGMNMLSDYLNKR